MGRVLLSCMAVLALSGCGLFKTGVSDAVSGIHGLDATTHSLGSPFSTTQTLIGLDMLSVINTQKTIDDHLVSWISGKDCSTVRASTGDRYCIDPPEVKPTVARTAYCYKSLAAVTCYDRPIERDAARFYGTHTDNIPISGQ